MKKLLVLVVLLGGCGVAGSQGYSWYNDQVYAPAAGHSQAVQLHVTQGETPEQLANDLASKGLIRNQEVFLVYVRSTGAGSKLQAGDFTLNTGMTMAQIVERLTTGQTTALTVRLVEGLTLAQMAAAVQKAGLASAQDYTAAAKPATWAPRFDFLASRPAGAPDDLEGFLFPDTYQVEPTGGAQALVQRQLQRFGEVVTPALRAEAAQPQPARPAESLWNIVVLASIVEREVNRDPDRAIVCGIFYNRLAAGMALGSDPTVLYGLGQARGPLTQQQLEDASNLYNTRVHTGLPPGPISNPGLASINACVNPQKTPYLYFFDDAKGVTRYARTYYEFQQLIQQYGPVGG